MSDEFTQEQKSLLSKPVIMIMPAFNGEWVIEVTTCQGDLVGRHNAVDNETLIASLRAAISNDDRPPRFEIN